MKIDLKRFAKFLGREVIPAVLPELKQVDLGDRLVPILRDKVNWLTLESHLQLLGLSAEEAAVIVQQEVKPFIIGQVASL